MLLDPDNNSDNKGVFATPLLKAESASLIDSKKGFGGVSTSVGSVDTDGPTKDSPAVASFFFGV